MKIHLWENSRGTPWVFIARNYTFSLSWPWFSEAYDPHFNYWEMKMIHLKNFARHIVLYSFISCSVRWSLIWHIYSSVVSFDFELKDYHEMLWSGLFLYLIPTLLQQTCPNGREMVFGYNISHLMVFYNYVCFSCLSFMVLILLVKRCQNITALSRLLYILFDNVLNSLHSK